LDVRNAEHLLDLLAIGNALDLSGCIDSRLFKRGSTRDAEEITVGIPPGEFSERLAITSAYRTFRDNFVKEYRLVVNGQPENPDIFLFGPYLVKMARAMLRYKEASPELSETPTLVEMNSAVGTYMGKLGKRAIWDKYKTEESPSSFEWQGQAFTVQKL
jgi:hypothetical protein